MLAKNRTLRSAIPGGRLLIVLAVLVLLAGTAASQQRDFSTVKVEAQKVAGSVWMLTGSGGNIGVSAGPDGVLIVDDQFAPLAEKIRAAIAGVDSGKLQYVLNTHWHGDHTGGNEIFGMEAAIVAHENVRARMEKGGQTRFGAVPPAPKVALPVITFKQDVSVHFNGEEIRVVHFPRAHTDGDAIIWFTKSGVIHMGDHFFNGGTFPFVDMGSGGNALGLERNIGKVIETADPSVKIIPGHGPLGTLDDLKRYHRMLVETIAHIKKGRDEGKTLDELKAAGVPEAWAELGKSGFIQTPMWVEIVNESLQQGSSGQK